MGSFTAWMPRTPLDIRWSYVDIVRGLSTYWPCWFGAVHLFPLVLFLPRSYFGNDDGLTQTMSGNCYCSMFHMWCMIRYQYKLRDWLVSEMFHVEYKEMVKSMDIFPYMHWHYKMNCINIINLFLPLCSPVKYLNADCSAHCDLSKRTERVSTVRVYHLPSQLKLQRVLQTSASRVQTREKFCISN